MSYRIIFLGKPASGKGTQSEILSKDLNLDIIQTGNIYRLEIEKQSEIGKIAKQSIEIGLFMPDDITNTLMLSAVDGKENYILDGYPRTINQAKCILNKITHVIEIDIPDDEVYKRVSGRRIHKASGRTYHIEYKKPINEGIDDFTGDKLEIRKDDDINIVKTRLDVYNKECLGISDYFNSNDLKVIKVSGLSPILKIADNIKSAIDGGNKN